MYSNQGGSDGKIDIEAYEDIMQNWAGEPPPEKHPESPLHWEIVVIDIEKTNFPRFFIKYNMFC